MSLVLLKFAQQRLGPCNTRKSIQCLWVLVGGRRLWLDFLLLGLQALALEVLFGGLRNAAYAPEADLVH